MIGNILAVAIGGAIGSTGRYLFVLWVGNQAVSGFPWGTLGVNTLGGLAIGLLAGLFALHPALPGELRLFLITGILGGFTTFSAFSLEVIELADRSAWNAALAYVGASLVFAVGGAFVGLRLGRWLLP